MNMRSPYQHFYVQDDWKVNDKLTLNIGVRYEYNPPFLETRDGIGFFDPGPRGSPGEIKIAGLDGTTRRMTRPGHHQLRAAPGHRLQAQRQDRAAHGLRHLLRHLLQHRRRRVQGNPNRPSTSRWVFRLLRTTPRRYPFKDGMPPGTISAANAKAVEMSGWSRPRIGRWRRTGTSTSSIRFPAIRSGRSATSATR